MATSSTFFHGNTSLHTLMPHYNTGKTDIIDVFIGDHSFELWLNSICCNKDYTTNIKIVALDVKGDEEETIYNSVNTTALSIVMHTLYKYIIKLNAFDLPYASIILMEDTMQNPDFNSVWDIHANRDDGLVYPAARLFINKGVLKKDL